MQQCALEEHWIMLWFAHCTCVFGFVVCISFSLSFNIRWMWLFKYCVFSYVTSTQQVANRDEHLKKKTGSSEINARVLRLMTFRKLQRRFLVVSRSGFFHNYIHYTDHCFNLLICSEILSGYIKTRVWFWRFIVENRIIMGQRNELERFKDSDLALFNVLN